MKKILLVAIITALLVITACAPKKEVSLDDFAKCLTTQDAAMFGTYTCSACLATIKMFGDSFQYIEYIECHPQGPNPQLERCAPMNITRTPLWIIKGERHDGFQTLEQLAEYSGCSLPEGA